MLLAAAPDPIVLVDGEGCVLYANPAAERVLAIESSLIPGTPLSRLALSSRDAAGLNLACSRVLAEGKPTVGRITIGDEQTGQTLEVHAAPCQQSGCVALSMHDISGYLKTEDELRASQDINRVLLLEVHHRVKNSLQVVSSFLQMQAWQADDAASRRSFEEACGRILSLAKVHEMLYRQGDLGRLDYAAVVRALVAEMAVLYGDERCIPDVAVRGSRVVLGLEKAVPVTLILHEWLTTHGPGAVEIDLTRPAEVRVLGVRPGDGTSLSSRMVAVLAAQLRGAVAYLDGQPPCAVLKLQCDDFGNVPGRDQESPEIV